MLSCNALSLIDKDIPVAAQNELEAAPNLAPLCRALRGSNQLSRSARYVPQKQLMAHSPPCKDDNPPQLLRYRPKHDHQRLRLL
jgi:hypothetical protein